MWDWYGMACGLHLLFLLLPLCSSQLVTLFPDHYVPGDDEMMRNSSDKSDLNLSICDASVVMELLSKDFLIGGLFPVHYYKDGTAVLNPYGITWVEAMHFAITELNVDDSILPGITLGYDMRDSCNQEETAIRHVLDFSLDAGYYARLVHKNDSNSSNAMKEQALERKLNESIDQCICSVGAINRLVAVVGGAASDVSAAVSNILGVSATPQISYSSTSVSLSDKQQYTSFMRTISADSFQAKAIADFLEHFNWTYVNVLAADDDYGRLGLDELRRETKMRGICLAVDTTFKNTLTQGDLDAMFRSLERTPGSATVVILWCQIGEAMTILEEATRRNITNKIWIGTESWGNSIKLFSLPDDLLHGIIGLKPTLESVPEFEAHLRELTPMTSFHNPWLDAYWVEKFGCRETRYRLGPKEEASLALLESFTDSLDNVTYYLYCNQANVSGAHLPFNKYSNVLAAVYAIAHGLHDLLGCDSGACDMTRILSSEGKLLEKMRSGTFKLPGNSNSIFFDANGDIASAAYTFTNLRVNGVDGHHFVDIGVWDGATGSLNVDVNKLAWANESVRHSHCSKPCSPGYHKLTGSSACCWSCTRCPPEQVTRDVNSNACHACALGEIANANRTECLRLSVRRFTLNSVQGSFVVALSTLGIVWTSFVLCLFVRCWSTPVVKSSNREMCVIQLICAMALFSYPVFYLPDFSTFNCIARPLYLALLLTISNSIICVKTYRLYRIFNKTLLAESKFLKNSSQLLVVGLVVFLQIVGIMIYHLYKSPQLQYLINPSARTIIYHCDAHEHVQLFIALGYMLLLKLTALFMAFKARKLPENFNEARFITLSMLTTILVWSVYLPMSFSVDKILQIYVLCLVNAISNMITVTSLYGKKLHIILFHPHLNDVVTFRRHTMQMTVKSFVQQPPVRRHTNGFSAVGTARPICAATPNGSPFYVCRSDMSTRKLGVSLTDFNLDMAMEFDTSSITA